MNAIFLVCSMDDYCKLFFLKKDHKFHINGIIPCKMWLFLETQMLYLSVSAKIQTLMSQLLFKVFKSNKEFNLGVSAKIQTEPTSLCEVRPQEEVFQGFLHRLGS
jgi:hypothetical protein